MGKIVHKRRSKRKRSLRKRRKSKKSVKRTKRTSKRRSNKRSVKRTKRASNKRSRKFGEGFFGAVKNMFTSLEAKKEEAKKEIDELYTNDSGDCTTLQAVEAKNKIDEQTDNVSIDSIMIDFKKVCVPP